MVLIHVYMSMLKLIEDQLEEVYEQIEEVLTTVEEKDNL